MPEGPAKFASLAEQSFARNLNDINAAFSDALRREMRFSSLTHSFVVDALGGLIPLPVISWCLGYSFGDFDGAVAGIAVSYALKKIMGQVSKRATPFLETSERLELKTTDMFRSQ